MNKLIKNTVILLVITLISGLSLGYVYDITKEPIARAEEAAKKEAWKEVFPDVDLNSFSVEETNEKSAEEALSSTGVQGSIDEVCKAGENGYIITATSKEGYGGSITVTVGITSEGNLQGISILSLSETPGLGMRATEEAFYGQYADKPAETLGLSKDGGEIDAISGATITSRALTGAVNLAIAYYQSAL